MNKLRKKLLNDKMKYQKEFDDKINDRLDKMEHKLALNYCKKACDEYSKEKTRKILEILNKI